MSYEFDATTFIALGTVGELDFLTHFNGTLVVLPVVRDEVSTEPERTNVERFVSREGVQTETSASDQYLSQAQEVLGGSQRNDDVHIVATVLERTDADERVGVVSDDQRVRTVSRGLGAIVTGTIGVVVHAVETELSAETGKEIVRKVDGHGLHMTGELREKAYELIDDATTE